MSVQRSAAGNIVPAAISWVLLVYTVPAQPTRKRAAVWREVKRLGAAYLRDGVCVLPDTRLAREGFEALAERVHALGGRATLAGGARLSPAAADALVAELAGARQREYAEALEAATALLRHVRAETVHHGFDRVGAVSVAGDLGRLERWLAQIVERDQLEAGDPTPVAEVLAACRAELAQHPVARPGQQRAGARRACAG